MKLAAKLAAVLLLGTIILLTIDGYVSVQRETALFESNMRRDSLLLGRAMKGLVAHSWKTDGADRAQQLLEDANTEEDRVSIRWVWLDCTPESDSQFCPHVPSTKLDPVQRGMETSLVYQDHNGRDRLYTYVPVAVDSQRDGAIELSESMTELVEHSRNSLLQTLLLIGALLLGSGVLAAALGIWLVGRPLRLLVEKTRRVGEGDLGGPLHLHGHDEITEVAESLNEMCQQLERSHEQIRSETAARIAALQELRHADRLKTVGRLASGMAHELGTPLNVVSARGALIADGSLSAEEIVESGEIIKTQSDRIATIVRQLLDFARRNEPHRTAVDLRQLARQTIKLLESYAAKRNASLSLSIGDHDAVSRVDAAQIQQVLTNLIVNAVQAMPSGGQVEVSLERKLASSPQGHDAYEGECLCLSVRDEGTGISKKNMDLLFEPFFTTKDVGKGTGLGLSIAYGIVREHVGWIDVSSEPGTGSCFTVYLPQEEMECKDES